MPQYLIEREIPGAGKLSADDRRASSRRSAEVLRTIAPRAQWQHSYFTDDKVFCVYLADDEAALREHAERVGVPVTTIHEIGAITDPTTAER